MLLERSLVLVLGVIFAAVLVNTIFSIYLGKEDYVTRLLQKLSFSFNDEIFMKDKANRLIFILLLLVAGLVLTILSK